MRKVDLEKTVTTPVLQVSLSVWVPLNDGSGGGEIVEGSDSCFLGESHGDIVKMFKKLLLDAKEATAKHQEDIRQRVAIAALVKPVEEEKRMVGADRVDPPREQAP